MSKELKNSIIFIIVAYLGSWIIWSFCWITNDSAGALLRIIGTFIPSVAGMLFAFYIGKSELKSLLKSSINYRLGLINTIYIFTVLPVIILLTYIIMTLIGIDTPSLSFRLFELPIVFIYIFALMGPLGEELGWRGYLLPKLFKLASPLSASCVIGLVWAIWHLPLFFIEGSLQYSLSTSYSFPLAFTGYIFYTILLSIFITIIFIRTKMNVLSALIIHTVANMSIGMMPVIFSTTGAIIQLLIMTLIIGSVAIANRQILIKKVI